MAFFVFLLDFLTKDLAVRYLTSSPFKILGNFFKLSLTFNTGAAFSIASSKTLFLTAFSVAVAVVIIFLGQRIDSARWAIVFGGLLGGIFGNLSDRIFREPGRLQGAVVDWISIGRWPVFNLADTAVVLSVLATLYLRWKNVPLKNKQDR